MSSESLPKEFEKTSEVLPIQKYGISTYQEFKEIEDDMKKLEHLKKVGLTNEEIDLYKKTEAGLLDRKNIEFGVLKDKLDGIYEKIRTHKDDVESTIQEESPSTSKDTTQNAFHISHKRTINFYPEGHPMNNIKELDEALFAHLKDDDMIPITKRKKILRHIERKKQRLLSQKRELITPLTNVEKLPRKGSLWDVKETPSKIPRVIAPEKPLIGPKKRTFYTIKDNKIVRLEPANKTELNKTSSNNLQLECNDKHKCAQNQHSQSQSSIELNNQLDERIEYKAVEIVIPMNTAEERLLEGTKMSVDNIKKIERFKDYEPGVPSKVLYLKNISTTVTQDRLSVLFNQFVLENQGPVGVKLMSGRMRGQAFVSFNDEDLAVRALDEINGTIMGGRPIIAQFGRNSQRIQEDHR